MRRTIANQKRGKCEGGSTGELADLEEDLLTGSVGCGIALDADPVAALEVVAADGEVDVVSLPGERQERLDLDLVHIGKSVPVVVDVEACRGEDDAACGTPEVKEQHDQVADDRYQNDHAQLETEWNPREL